MPLIWLRLLFLNIIPIAEPAMNELKQNQIINRVLPSMYLGVRIRSKYTASGSKNAMTAIPNQAVMINIGLNQTGVFMKLSCGDEKIDVPGKNNAAIFRQLSVNKKG